MTTIIITRHMSDTTSRMCYRRCVALVRLMFPEHPVIVIDDHSKVRDDDYVLPENVTVVDSVYPAGRAELIPYLYMLEHEEIERALVIHDTVFIHNRFDLSTESVAFLWHFAHKASDNVKDIEYLATKLRDTDAIVARYHQQSWVGCFGVMSIITRESVLRLENRFGFSNLVDHIDSRQRRESLERLFAIMCTLEFRDVCTVFEDILTHIHVHNEYVLKWVFDYDSYIRTSRALPAYKVRLGRSA
jgi:hypothetical protein